MKDVVLITADSIRRDFVDALPYIDSHDVMTGVTAGHYTRPSLAALQSSRLGASVQSKVIGPTLAEVFSNAGYKTIGLAPTAQADPTFGFDAGFDYYNNYMSGSGNAAQNRRSNLREYLGSFDIVRQVYRRLYPMEANMADLPPDEAVADEAINRFNAADRPRFLWVHQMESHRPYGRDVEAIPRSIDRKAEASGSRYWFGSSEISHEERKIIIDAYRNALHRVDNRIKHLIDSIDSEDPIVAFASDHGDEFGEEDYYYHQGYRRRVADSIIRVPVVFDGVDTVCDCCSLLDISPTLVGAVGADIPSEWQGNDLAEEETKQAITVAPWHDSATIAWQDFERKLVARDAIVSMTDEKSELTVERTDVSKDVEARLRDLGYSDAG